MTEFFGSSVPFSEPLWYSRRGNPNYAESHRRLRGHIRQYVDNEIAPFCETWEAAGCVPREVLERHAMLGYTAAVMNPASISDYLGDIKPPASISPDEWNHFHDLIAIDEMARCGSLGVLWALGCGNAIGCPPLVNFGTAEQKSRFLPAVIRGETRFCLAITESQAGSDVANIETTARVEGEVLVVNGKKEWVTNGMFADYCTTVVRTGCAGKIGISLLIIPLHSTGVSRSKIETSGVFSSGCGSLTFENVRVPASNVIGPLNEGFSIIMKSLNHERLWIAGNCLRLARVCLDDAYRYSLTRHTFGRPLIERQAIRSKFVNIGMQVMGAYALLESLVQARENSVKDSTQGSSSRMEASTSLGGLCALVKVMSARAIELAVRESQQIMGALGYTRTGAGARIERISRDLRTLVIGGGSEEVMTDLALLQEGKDVFHLSQSVE